MSQESCIFKHWLLDAQVIKCPRCRFFVRMRYRFSNRDRWEVCKPCIISLMTQEELIRYRADASIPKVLRRLCPI